MKRIIVSACIAAIFLLLLGGGYFLFTRKPVKELEFPLTLVSGKSLPIFNDDLNGDGLKEAIAHHIKKMKAKDLVNAIRPSIRIFSKP